MSGMLDSGSGPMVADCPRCFPDHAVRPNKAQLSGTCYTSACRGEIPNEGEITIVHRNEEGQDFGFVIQNAKVECPILSVRYFTRTPYTSWCNY